ncbi:MAG: hypothetical protein H7647_01965 [Candidatus Heimdallarchaeota archaeon]|nr:hypothetical protein [Candidatus Heimdallarchaeota archaeon]MCK4253194.1 hypothetical protein [Candidatus Heimdallarchaeota archaeon]
MIAMDIDDILVSVNNIDSQAALEIVLKDLRILSYNKKANDQVIMLLDKAISKAKETKFKRILLNLYSLKISQIHHLKPKIQEIIQIIEKMQLLLENLDYAEGYALYYSHLWYIEKIQGNEKKAKKYITKSAEKLNVNNIEDEFVYYTCKYTYAVEKWLEEHDSESAIILEECVRYFFKEGYYRSLAQTVGLLSIIYSRLHENTKALNLSNSILANRDLFENLPLDVKGIIYYFTGLGYMLDANLAVAESYFNETYNILKPIYKDSIYFAYYLVLLSYLATVKGLQGETELAVDMVKETDTLLQTEFIKKNLDENSKKQITHTHNLTKFYNLSRLSNYNSQEHQELVEEIYEGCKAQYSDFMTFSEFILNSNLDSAKLQSLLTIDNFSINRVKHLTEFMLEKQKLETENSQEQKTLNCISILEKRVTTSKTTFMEHAYADLLIAQQLFSLKRYAEISPLLKQYENRLQRIEVLELRVFMEAFIQVGAYKNGDPLGPALQYMAIKKCRLYGFSRLENTLLDYLQLQQNEITRTI